MKNVSAKTFRNDNLQPRLPQATIIPVCVTPFSSTAVNVPFVAPSAHSGVNHEWKVPLFWESTSTCAIISCDRRTSFVYEFITDFEFDTSKGHCRGYWNQVKTKVSWPTKPFIGPSGDWLFRKLQNLGNISVALTTIGERRKDGIEEEKALSGNDKIIRWKYFFTSREQSFQPSLRPRPYSEK